MLMSVYPPVAVKDLLGNVSEEKMNDVSAWINCVFIFGWMFGGIAWGVICDRIGRSKSVMLSHFLWSIYGINSNSAYMVFSECMQVSQVSALAVYS